VAVIHALVAASLMIPYVLAFVALRDAFVP
jgi:hypothetical protein